MKLLKVEYYACGEKQIEAMINLDDISWIDLEKYEHYEPFRGKYGTEYPPNPTFADPYSIAVVLKSGGRLPLTELSAQVLILQLKELGYVINSS